MQQAKLLLLGFFLLTFGYAKGQIELKKSKVTIAGKVDNAVDKTFSFIALELTGRKEHTIKINDDGSFHATFHVLSAHDNMLKYNRNLVPVFLEPDDSLYFTADGGDFQQTIQFSGDNASSNTALQLFFSEFAKLMESENLFGIMRNPNPNEFKELMTAFFRKMDTEVDIIEKENQFDRKIIKWMKAYNKYRLAEELFEYGRNFSEHGEKFDKDLPEDYYDFVDEYANAQEQSDFYCYKYYEGYLGELYSYKFRKYEESKKISEYFINGEFYSYLKATLEMTSEREDINAGIELYLTRVCHMVLERGDFESVDSVFAEYTKVVTNKSYQKDLKQAINERRFNENDYSLDDLAALEFVGEIFSEIKEKHQGKVLYIDFWGTWCKPCLKEFPYSKALHNELKDEDVEFVYLGCSSKKEDWEKSIKKYNLAGTHYLLTDDQYAMLAGEFISTGFPQYMVIDKKGVVVNRDADRPSGEKTEAYLISLAKE